MFKVFSIVISCLFIIACNNNNPQPVVNNNLEDTIVAKQPVLDTLAPLKNITINEAYYEQKVKQTKKLADSTIQSLSLTDIEDINRSTETPVKILDTLWSTDTDKIIVVALDAENEMSAYIVHLKNNRLKQFEQVYYADVVEYFMSISTVITNNKVVITKTTDIDDKKSKEIKTFVLKEDGLQLEK